MSSEIPITAVIPCFNAAKTLTRTYRAEDPAYLNQPFVRTYQFKKQPDAAGWEPTACLPR